MFYDFIYLAKGFRMRPKVRSTLNDEIDAFIGYFKLRLDLTNLNKYLAHYFDGPRFLGRNNTNLIICGL